MTLQKKPEEIAREWIDKRIEEAGWALVNRDEYHPSLNAAVIREALLTGKKEADYYFLINGKAVAVLEAKRESISTNNKKLIAQAEDYAVRSSPISYSLYRSLPFVLLSNGKEIVMRDFRQRDSEYENTPFNTVPTPKEFCKKLHITSPFAQFPALSEDGLRECQFDAVTHVEETFKNHEKRALITMATGAGKTYTACLIAYRFLTYGEAKRVLFLVDRTNLGTQALEGFGTFTRTEKGEVFSNIYTVGALKSDDPEKAKGLQVVVSTIQKLYAAITGYEEEPETDASVNAEDTEPKDAVQLTDQMRLPPDFFDLIIVDECHRSIYGRWKAVLNYFSSARVVGLTATPTAETFAFFDGNQVSNYTFADSIRDGVNVPPRVYSIGTELASIGGTVKVGERIIEKNKLTQNETEIVATEEKDISAESIGRTVLAEKQIEAVLEQYKEAVYTEFFPNRRDTPDFASLPKTLIFAHSEEHAKLITKVAKRVFGHEGEDDPVRHSDTYSQPNPQNLIRQFRTGRDIRIAVTVTLIATGTDIKPLEVIIFMTDVKSEVLYVQMQGRGCRSYGTNELRNVTPNADKKECFYLVDASGVTESNKTLPQRTGNKVTPVAPKLDVLFELLSHGHVSDENLGFLVNKLDRIKQQKKEQFEALLSRFGVDMDDLLKNLTDKISTGSLPPYEEGKENAERMACISDLLNKIPLRKALIELAAASIVTLPDTEDKVISSGFSKEDATLELIKFKQFLEHHKDDIEALKLILGSDPIPVTYPMLRNLKKILEHDLPGFSIARVWNNYQKIYPDKVQKISGTNELSILTNLIQLVRFAFDRISNLTPLTSTARRQFALWCGQKQRSLTEEEKEIFRRISQYIVENGAISVRELSELDNELFVQLVKLEKGPAPANSELSSLAAFLLQSKIS